MEVRSEQVFRRVKESFTWHFREDCWQFPKVYGYITKQLRLPLHFQMVCAVCKRLAKEEEDRKLS